MTETAYPTELLELTQISDACGCIAHKVLSSGILHVSAPGFTRGTVVVAKRGDAIVGKEVGNEKEWLMLHQLFIAVLLTATRHEQNDWCLLGMSWVISQRIGQRT